MHSILTGTAPVLLTGRPPKRFVPGVGHGSIDHLVPRTRKWLYGESDQNLVCAALRVIFNLIEPVSAVLLRRMTDAIADLGPDGEGFYIDSFIGLGHRRLGHPRLSRPAINR